MGYGPFSLHLSSPLRAFVAFAVKILLLCIYPVIYIRVLCTFLFSCYTYHIMTIEQTVDIPASRRLTIEVPREVPTGKTQVVIRFPDPAEALSSVPAEGDGCPLCAIYKEPNEETIAAFKEGDAMMRGEIPANRFHSIEELFADLDS
ncbi:hypothetical protein FACS1894147_01500 [Spirochaetia bacterium]|nr:hypothetical protein FACS1894147_01500 [Spirochaetia bacterium]